MRIIAGSLRGLRLTAPEGLNTRPTLDRVKEAVFSMLMPYLSDARVLDLFAGSGAMGIEALSRGASDAVFIDNDKTAISCIKNNIQTGNLENSSTVINTDALKYLSECKGKFDIIFLDPPYFKNAYTSVLDSIYSNDILSDNGLIIAEWDYENGFDYNCENFTILKEKKYGRVGITVLNRGVN